MAPDRLSLFINLAAFSDHFGPFRACSAPPCRQGMPVDRLHRCCEVWNKQKTCCYSPVNQTFQFFRKDGEEIASVE